MAKKVNEMIEVGSDMIPLTAADYQ